MHKGQTRHLLIKIKHV